MVSILYTYTEEVRRVGKAHPLFLDLRLSKTLHFLESVQNLDTLAALLLMLTSHRLF
jgi:hypothetical protein